MKRWRAAREVIDWSRPGGSLLDRKRPLSLKTRLRIARGLQRFGGPLAHLYITLLDLPADEAAKFGAAADDATPFVVVARENNVPKSVEQPLGTITTLPAMYVVTPTAEPFVMANRAHNVPKSADAPVPTITSAGGGGMFLVEPTSEPFVLGQQSGSVPRSSEDPLPTIAAAGAISLVKPILTPYHGNSEAASVDEPLGTQTTKARFGLCTPLAVPYGPRAEARSVEDPLVTITTKDRLGLCTPLIVQFYGDRHGLPRTPTSPDAPLPTVTTEPRFGVCTPTAEPFLVPKFGERGDQQPRVHDLDSPLPTVTSEGAGRLVEPVIVQVAFTHQAGPGVRSASEPLPTVTAGARLGVAEPIATPLDGQQVDPRRVVLIDGVPHLLDIRFRMLFNRELARAMGFDDQEIPYEFTGTIQQVTRQIGNAVPVNTAAALVTSVLIGDSERAVVDVPPAAEAVA